MMRCLFAERTHDELNESECEEPNEGPDRAFSCVGRIDFVVHFCLLFNVRLFEVDYILPRTVNVRIDMRTWSNTMIRINGHQDNRAMFVRRSLPGHGRYRAVTVRRDDRGGRSYRLR